MDEHVKSEPEPKRRPFKEYGDKVRIARQRLDLSQKDLADKLGMNTSSTWVSQVESGTLEANERRKNELAACLGDEELRAKKPDPRRISESQAFVTVWRIRADMLDKIATRMNDRPTRRRLTRLQADLLRAARVHPRLSDVTNSGDLPSSLELADRYRVPEWIRRLALIEVAGMRLDAPAHIRPSVDGDTWRERLEVVDRLAENLFTEDELDLAETSPQHLADRVKKAFSTKVGERSHKWLDLRPTGGGQGAAQALLADPTGAASVLLGFDPFGWMGLEYLAGRWLLPTGRSQWRTTADDPEALVEQIRTHAAQASVGGLAGAAVGSSYLGPVLGSLVGAAIAGLFASSDTASTVEKARNQFATEATDDQLTDQEQLLQAVTARAEADTTARIWDGFGRVRGEFELMKIIALYTAYPDWAASGNPDADIPPVRLAAQHLGRVQEVFGEWYADETKASGTDDGSKNNRLRRLAEMHKAAKYGSEILAKLTP